MNIHQRGLLILLKSAVSGLKLELPEGFDPESEEVSEIVSKHKIVTLFYQGAVNCGVDPKSPYMTRVFSEYYKFMLYSEKQMKLVQSLFNAFDENGIDYVLVGDYYVPDLKLPEEHRPIGKWGNLHRAYLKQYQPP